MNIFKNLRKPYISLFLASLVLFVSCEKSIVGTDSETEADYSVYQEFTNSENSIDYSKSRASSTAEEAQALLDEINATYGTEISFPEEFLALTDASAREIEATAFERGWINNDDIYLVDSFEYDLQKSNFDTALENYEKNVIKLELSEAEFQDKMLAANGLKLLNDANPDLFKNSRYGSRGWGCFRAAAALVLSSVALASCATVLACGLAVSAWILSYSAYADNCMNN